MPLYEPSASPDEAAQRALAARSEAAQYSLRVFRSLEQDLLDFERHVPLEANHLKVFSVELWSVILRACAEVDSQLHSVLNELGLASGDTDRRLYREAEAHLRLGWFEFRTVPTPMDLVPFGSFLQSPPKSPGWWRDYNAVKHNRIGAIRAATFENALDSVAGVAAVLLRQWGPDLFPRPLYLNASGDYSAPFPSRLLTLEKMPWQR